MNQLPPDAAAEMARAIARRHAAIRRAGTPLPGSQPRDRFKALNIPAAGDGLPLLAALGLMVGNVSAAEWLEEFARGRVVDLKQTPVAATRIVRAGQRYQHRFPGATEPEVNGGVEILHEDEALIVVNKPAPLPMHAGGRFYDNTLQHLLNAAYAPQTPLPVHRLDANTTGLVLAARTRAVARQLQEQFQRGRVEKTYLARIQGPPPADAFSCAAPISAESGAFGSRTVDAQAGQPARTEFIVRQRLADGTTLLAARPLTGRTHQIRVHLWHLGHPVCGDALYLPGHQRGHTTTLAVGAPPLCLHAWQVKLLHPLSGSPVAFTAPLPAWANQITI